MIRFVSISSFRARLAALLKIKRGVYSGVSEEICHSFRGHSIDQIRQNRDMILISNDAVVIKLRVPDRNRRLSRADGYRLIYMVLKTAPLVVLLDVYPKRGPMQQLDIDDKAIVRLLQTFVAEEEANDLVFHDIDNGLREINQSDCNEKVVDS